MLQKDVVLDEEVALVLLIVTISFFGSLAKNYYNLLFYHKKMKIGEILLSTITASIIEYSFSSYLLPFLGYRLFIGNVFVLGLIGIEVIGKLSKLNDILLLLKVILFRDKEALKKLLDEDDKSTKNDKDINNNNRITINIKK